jgi:Flp pilus assembly protein CpaB
MSTRRGTLLVGATAGAVALIVVLVYLNRYRDSIQAANGSVPVLVAKVGIQKGSPGDVVATGGQFRVDLVPRAQVLPLAFVDPDALRGTFAQHDIFPGQQLTVKDFAPSVAGSLQSSLTGQARAIGIAIDGSHGLLGDISAGDHVDIYMGLSLQGLGGARPVIKLLATDVLVLRAPGAGSGNLVLRGRGAETAKLAYAADNAKLWIVLRPANTAKPVNPGIVDVNSVLALKPLKAR